MSDVWTIELEKEESAITAELAQQSGESYTLPMAGPDILGGVKPVQKTDEMTNRVGIDENGRLWSEKESEQVLVEGAKVGQVLVVKSVDNDGKPTELEGIDIDIKGEKGDKGDKGEPGVYTLSEGESLENVPSDASVIIDPYGMPDHTIVDIIAEALEVINNDTY